MIFIFCSIFKIVLKKVSRNHKKCEDEKYEILPFDNNFEKQIPDCSYGNCFIQFKKIIKIQLKK